MKNPKKLIELKGLEKSFGETTVLKGIDLSVVVGEALSIIGPSGSGKSTLIRCLNLLEDFSGEYIFESHRVEPDSVDVSQFRQNFGMVFQSFNLFPHLTVLENITEGPVRVQKRPKNKVVHEAKLLLEQVGIEDKVSDYPQSLSGGQKQRVAIARALAMRPKVLLFDEPTSALDPEMVSEVLEVIRSLKNKQTTMVLVTHEMEFAKNISDQIVFLADGRVVEKGTPDELFKKASTSRLRAFLSSM